MNTDFKELAKLFDRPIAYHRAFISLGAGVSGAVLLSQLWYWSARCSDPDGWIYKTQDEWEEETGLSPDEQRTARKHLVQSGVLEEERRGIPARLFYKINVDILLERLGVNIKILPLPTSGREESPYLDNGNAHIFNKSAETTPETTAENTNNNIVEPPADLPDPAKMERERIVQSLQGAQPIMDHTGMNVIDLSKYPEDVRPVIGKVCQLWKLKPPQGKSKGYWIEGSRALEDACGEFGLDLLDEIHGEWLYQMERNQGIPKWTVEGPQSLEKTARALAGRKRQAGNISEGNSRPISSDDWYRVMARR